MVRVLMSQRYSLRDFISKKIETKFQGNINRFFFNQFKQIPGIVTSTIFMSSKIVQ